MFLPIKADTLKGADMGDIVESCVGGVYVGNNAVKGAGTLTNPLKIFIFEEV